MDEYGDASGDTCVAIVDTECEFEISFRGPSRRSTQRFIVSGESRVLDLRFPIFYTWSWSVTRTHIYIHVSYLPSLRARVHVCVLSDAAEKESFARQRCCIGGGGVLT